VLMMREHRSSMSADFIGSLNLASRPSVSYQLVLSTSPSSRASCAAPRSDSPASVSRRAPVARLTSGALSSLRHADICRLFSALLVFRRGVLRLRQRAVRRERLHPAAAPLPFHRRRGRDEIALCCRIILCRCTCCCCCIVLFLHRSSFQRFSRAAATSPRPRLPVDRRYHVGGGGRHPEAILRARQSEYTARETTPEGRAGSSDGGCSECSIRQRSFVGAGIQSSSLNTEPVLVARSEASKDRATRELVSSTNLKQSMKSFNLICMHVRDIDSAGVATCSCAIFVEY
jgi:hypothetical protein